MRSSQQYSGETSTPILIRDRAPFYRGFMLGSLVAVAIYLAIYARIMERQSPQLTSAMAATMAAGDSPFTEMAIARAEEINGAVAAYVESCGPDLATRAWREAAVPEERYQLLSSFIAFSPDSLSDYMPEDYEIVLWEDLRGKSEVTKVELLAAGSVVEY